MPWADEMGFEPPVPGCSAATPPDNGERKLVCLAKNLAPSSPPLNASAKECVGFNALT